MSIFSRNKPNKIAQRKIDEHLYALVAEEMETGIRSNGLWLKALELAEGNKEKQVSEYIKLRVQSLVDDMYIDNSYNSPTAISSTSQNSNDMDEFIEFLSKNPNVEALDYYFSTCNPTKITTFINTYDSCEEYPLHYCTKHNYDELVIWFLNNGANRKLKNYWGKTPLDIAIANKNQALIDILSH